MPRVWPKNVLTRAPTQELTPDDDDKNLAELFAKETTLKSFAEEDSVHWRRV